jgi:hypothetical protein
MHSDELPSVPYYAGLTFPAPFDALWSYRKRPASDLNSLKAARAAIVWRANKGKRVIVQSGRYLGWVTRFPENFVRFLVTRGGEARTRFGRSYRGQIADMVKLACVNGLMPRDYYAGGLARHGGTEALYRYLPFHLYEAVTTHLLIERSASQVAFVEDKYALEQRCRELGLPVVRTVAIAHPDGVHYPTDETGIDALPPYDLLAKPVDGGQGKDIERWRFAGPARYLGANGETLSSDDLIAHFCARARAVGSAMLIQRCLENNAELHPISGAALSTTRIVTFLNEKEEPEIVEAFYRSSYAPDAATDNFHNGGVLFPVDHETGRLADGCCESRAILEPIVEHPQTGSKVSKELLPNWSEMSELALRAHRAFSDLLLVGWDVAYTKDGPVLIEANTPPGITLERQAAAGALVGTRFIALLAFHARRWLELAEPINSRWRRARATSSSDID